MQIENIITIIYNEVLGYANVTTKHSSAWQPRPI